MYNVNKKIALKMMAKITLTTVRQNNVFGAELTDMTVKLLTNLMINVARRVL